MAVEKKKKGGEVLPTNIGKAIIKIRLIYVFRTNAFFPVAVNFFILRRKKKKKKKKEKKELESDDIKDTNSSATSRGRSLTQFRLCNSCMQKQ